MAAPHRLYVWRHSHQLPAALDADGLADGSGVGVSDELGVGVSDGVGVAASLGLGVGASLALGVEADDGLGVGVTTSTWSSPRTTAAEEAVGDPCVKVAGAPDLVALKRAKLDPSPESRTNTGAAKISKAARKAIRMPILRR